MAGCKLSFFFPDYLMTFKLSLDNLRLPFILCLCVFSLHVYMCMCMSGALRGQKVPDALELILQMVVAVITEDTTSVSGIRT